MKRTSNFEFEDDEKPSIRIKVKTLLGKEAKYLIRPNEQITRLRSLVQKSFDISPRQQCLINEGVIMEDGKTVKDYSVGNGSLINLIIK
jgi:hypothetical protein